MSPRAELCGACTALELIDAEHLVSYTPAPPAAYESYDPAREMLEDFQFARVGVAGAR